MPGEQDLGKLLRAMDPVLHDDEFVFCCVAEDRLAADGSRAVGMFREPGGVTLILRRADAERAKRPDVGSIAPASGRFAF